MSRKTNFENVSIFNIFLLRLSDAKVTRNWKFSKAIILGISRRQMTSWIRKTQFHPRRLLLPRKIGHFPHACQNYESYHDLQPCKICKRKFRELPFCGAVDIHQNCAPAMGSPLGSVHGKQGAFENPTKSKPRTRSEEHCKNIHFRGGPCALT